MRKNTEKLALRWRYLFRLPAPGKYVFIYLQLTPSRLTGKSRPRASQGALGVPAWLGPPDRSDCIVSQSQRLLVADVSLLY